MQRHLICFALVVFGFRMVEAADLILFREPEELAIVQKTLDRIAEAFREASATTSRR